MDKIKNFDEFINESLSQDMYHFTSLNNLYKILGDNQIKMSYADDYQQQFQKEKYFFSLSRNRDIERGMGTRFKDNIGILKLNYKLLNNNHKSKPNDYYHPYKNSNHTKEVTKQYSDLETEDRIVSNKQFIDNIRKFIVEVNVISSENIYDNYKLRSIITFCDKYNITLNIYDTKENYNKKKPITIDISDKELYDDSLLESIAIKDRKIKLGDKIHRGKIDNRGFTKGVIRNYRVIGLNPNLKLQEVLIIDGFEELGKVEEFDWDLQNKLFPMFPNNDAMDHIWKGDF